MSDISLRDVKKIYELGHTEVTALNGVSLEVLRAEFIGVIGPSGSGKTTLLNLIGCIDVPTSGKVFVSGKDTSLLDDDRLTLLRRRHIGFIFQSFNLIPVLTAFENVELPLISLGVPAGERRKKVAAMLEAVGIIDHAAHKPDELSGGQRQRVAIARALIIEPDIVLADEPTANLDSGTGNKIVELMRDMNERLKTTFVISTHDPRLLSYIGKKVYLEDGKIVRITDGEEN